MPSCPGRRRLGLLAALLVAVVALLAAAACGGTSAEGTGAPSSGGTDDVTEAEASGGTRAEGTDAAASSTGGVTGAEAGGEVFFPEHRETTALVGLNGRVVEDAAGCLRFEISEDDAVTGVENPTVLWPRPWSAERGKDGRVRFFDVEGRAVGRTDEEVQLVGSPLPEENPLEEVPSVDESAKRELLQRCPGQYYFAGGFEPPYTRRGETTSSRG